MTRADAVAAPFSALVWATQGTSGWRPAYIIGVEENLGPVKVRFESGQAGRGLRWPEQLRNRRQGGDDKPTRAEAKAAQVEWSAAHGGTPACR